MNDDVVLVQCALGVARIAIDDEDVVDIDHEAELPKVVVDIDLPLLVTADAQGPRIVAVVNRRPPLVVSDDAGMSWRESGGGLPAGRAVAISPNHPDLMLFAGRSRLYVSRDGGRFWHALAVELPEIERVAWAEL